MLVKSRRVSRSVPNPGCIHWRTGQTQIGSNLDRLKDAPQNPRKPIKSRRENGLLDVSCGRLNSVPSASTKRYLIHGPAARALRLITSDVIPGRTKDPHTHYPSPLALSTPDL